MKNKILVSPSLLSANFADLGNECKRLQQCGADWVHCDVMDGVFVPNLSMGIKTIADIRPYTTLPLDVHLMITSPERYIVDFVKAGADIITFHLEATDKIVETIQLIKNSGKKVGISIKPNTTTDKLLPYINDIDMVLVMSVEPGFGAQKFMPQSIKKVQEVRQMSSTVWIQVDGGVNADNAKLLIEAGANVLVAGTTVFKAQDMAKAIESLRE